MRRDGFTLIELLVIIAIMATMVTVGVVGMNASRSASRLAGAGRDVMAMIRRARSLALVTQRPVVLVYSNVREEDESYAKVEIHATKIFSSPNKSEVVYNLAGEVVKDSLVDAEGSEDGETLEDVLAPESIPVDVVKGLKVKVLDESDELSLPENETRRSKISIFSTADNVSRTLGMEKTAGETLHREPEESSGETEDSDEPLSVAFAVNGTVNPPHRIYLYREGSAPESGLLIHVDRFGEPVCEDIR